MTAGASAEWQDRNRLANACFKDFGSHLARNQNGRDAHYTEADFRKDVRRFCGGLSAARILIGRGLME